MIMICNLVDPIAIHKVESLEIWNRSEDWMGKFEEHLKRRQKIFYIIIAGFVYCANNQCEIHFVMDFVDS